MTTQKTPLEIPYSSYSFRRWLEEKEVSGRTGEFIDRLKSDPLAPHSIGPRTPAVLMNYVMRLLEQDNPRVSYQHTDISVIYDLWTMWQYEVAGVENARS